MRFTRWAVCILLLATPVVSLAHGSVTADDDLCRIQIGHLTAHFKVYLPRARQHQEFCEDLPESGEAVFVMEYIHSELDSVAVDFRIIRNVTGLGRFATLEDVRSIEDLESATVLYKAARVQPDVFTVLHNFEQTGEYLGIVTATNPQTQRVYSAVFPFEVSYFRLGQIPLFLMLALLVQLSYWLATRGGLPWRRTAAMTISKGSDHEA